MTRQWTQRSRRSLVRPNGTTAGPRTPTARIDRLVALGVAGVALVSGALALAGPEPLPRWRDCDDAVTIVDRRLPAPPGEV